MSEFECRICGNIKANKIVSLKGTFYGTKGQYDYCICGKCGCLQIVDMPEDISRYYDVKSYYSFNMDNRNLKNKLLFKQMESQVSKGNIVGRLVEFLYPVDYSFYTGIPKEKWILDVGCGQGEMLNWLSKLGYTHLEGVEPFLDNSIEYPNGVIINKSEICDFEPQHSYRLITFVHSLEHIFDEREVLHRVADWLDEDGEIVVVIPFLSRYYWGKYGTNLHTLDPPRHFYLHTYESLVTLMEECGMKIKYFDTRFIPSIPWMAHNNKKGCSEKNEGANYFLDSIISICSLPLRRRLSKNKDGAVATAVFEKDSTF